MCVRCLLRLRSLSLSLSCVISRGCMAGALCQRWGILWRRLQCDFMLQPKVISLCTKLHNFCNKYARDALRNGASERPSACDASFDLESERERRQETRRGGSVQGTCQPKSRRFGQDRLPPLSAVREYNGAPAGWRPRAHERMKNMNTFREECVEKFESLDLQRPPVSLSVRSSRPAHN